MTSLKGIIERCHKKFSDSRWIIYELQYFTFPLFFWGKPENFRKENLLKKFWATKKSKSKMRNLIYSWEWKAEKWYGKSWKFSWKTHQENWRESMNWSDCKHSATWHASIKSFHKWINLSMPNQNHEKRRDVPIHDIYRTFIELKYFHLSIVLN